MQIDRTTGGGMPPRKVRKKTPPPAAAAASGRHRLIGDLPDDALQRVLSFLPAQDAVRTCVLARRWRHVWKSAPGLRILCGGARRRKFAEDLLRVRGSTPIDECEFRLLNLDEVDAQRIDFWIRYVLQRNVRVLRINQVQMDDGGYGYDPVDLPLISQHLKKLQLQNIYSDFVWSGFLDFSSCPVLQDPEIHGCDLSAGDDGLLSQSLKRLSIDGCKFDFPMKICAPNLVSLWLKVDDGSTTPSFERMPSLLEAVCDYYDKDDDDDDVKCFLLHSLSEAQSLALIGHVAQYRTRSELKSYPTFNKLKTLHLNEYWSEPPEFSSLARLLEHSPVLERLTLQLYSEDLNTMSILN